MFLPIGALWLLAATTPSAKPSFETVARQANEARDGKRFADALALYKKALRLRPAWEEGWWNAGSIAYDQDKYAECAPDFHKLATLKPDLAPAWTMAGLCEYHLRDYPAALKSLLRVEGLNFAESAELSRAARLHLALVLTKLGNFEKAIVVLLQLTRSDKKSPEIIVASGIAGLRQRWIPSEVPEPDRDKVFKLGDAMAAVMELDNQGAVGKFETALHDYPNDANVHFRFGAYLMQQDAERGIQEIKKALELEPNHVPALVALSSIYLQREETQPARENAEKAVKASPADFATHVALGRVLLQSGDEAGAVRELEMGAQLAPESPEAHFSLANAYAKLGRKEDAQREREEFRRLRKLIHSNQP